jgi:hypothetical protein
LSHLLAVNFQPTPLNPFRSRQPIGVAAPHQLSHETRSSRSTFSFRQPSLSFILFFVGKRGRGAEFFFLERGGGERSSTCGKKRGEWLRNCPSFRTLPNGRLP